MTRSALVTGAAGFIGHRLVRYLKGEGYEVRGADLEAYPHDDADEFLEVDLRERAACDRAVDGVEEVYHLAADTGGAGPFRAHHAAVCRNNTSINLHMLEAAAGAGVDRFLFSSSGRVYPQAAFGEADSEPLAEEDAWPADPEPGLGEEKLYAERLCAHYREDVGLDTRVVRLEEVYGPGGPYEGGRETAPAALCRQVAVTADGGTITLWGDGRRTGSYLYVEDCVEGIHRIMRSGRPGPLNLAPDRRVTVNELVEIVRETAGRDVTVEHDLGKPGGGPGRSLDPTRLRKALGWEPRVEPEEGIPATYAWIEEQMRDTAAAHRHPGPPHIP